MSDEYIDDLPNIVAVGKTDYIDDVGKLEFYTNKAFDALMGQRTDNASRSPVFRQAYWRTIYDLLPYMSGKMRQVMLEGGTYSIDGKEIKVAQRRMQLEQKGFNKAECDAECKAYMKDLKKKDRQRRIEETAGYQRQQYENMMLEYTGGLVDH
jgi:hypothetical protein